MSQAKPDKDSQASEAKKAISLPISRVKLIMKSSPDVSSINQDALFLTTKATELFVQHLALTSFNNGSGREANTLDYSDLAKTAEETDTFHFLTERKTQSPWFAPSPSPSDGLTGCPGPPLWLAGCRISSFPPPRSGQTQPAALPCSAGQADGTLQTPQDLLCFPSTLETMVVTRTAGCN
uniref:Chromatin accessibility complex protein 1 n=1 Tax=Cyprinodon variegatus TaxID=28743 RepID=A0A3Q2DEU9_CYPVA